MKRRISLNIAGITAALLLACGASPAMAQAANDDTAVIVADTATTVVVSQYYIDKNPDLWPSRATFDGPGRTPRNRDVRSFHE